MNTNQKLGVMLLVMLFISSCGKTIVFQEENWIIKDSQDPQGPGPNYFLAKNVEFDDDGMVHLKISKDEKQWSCSEIYLPYKLGQGKYRFKVESPLNNLDPHMVFGMFLYYENRVDSVVEEIDIEVLKHVDKTKEAAFTIQNRDISLPHYYQQIFIIDTPDKIDFEITWKEDIISFSAKTVSGDLLSEGSYTDVKNFPSVENPVLHINFYLFQGRDPVLGNEAEIVIKEVSFKK